MPCEVSEEDKKKRTCSSLIKEVGGGVRSDLAQDGAHLSFRGCGSDVYIYSTIEALLASNPGPKGTDQSRPMFLSHGLWDLLWAPEILQRPQVKIT